MKQKFFSLMIAAMAAAAFFLPQSWDYLGNNAAYAASISSVSKPVCSLASGAYYASQGLSVTLSCETEGAVIYYSTGGGYKAYSKKIFIKENTTLNFYAVKDDGISEISSYNYKLVPKVSFSAAGGEYPFAQRVKLSSAASGVKFYYTLDGSKPTTSSALYDVKGIKIDESCTLRVLAKKSGWSVQYYRKEYILHTEEKIIPKNSLVEEYKDKYFYNLLNKTEKEIYKRLYNAVSQHKNKIDVSDLNVKAPTVDKAYWAFDYENAQFFWLKNGYSYTYSSYYNGKVYDIIPDYSRNEKQAESLLKGFESVSGELAEKALKLEDAFMQLKTVHDEIIKRTDYVLGSGGYISEADGPLLYGKALCEGYSKAFMYIAQKLGYECICVIGSVDDVGHMWNMVKIGDKWYHVDLTFDDPVGGERTCLDDYFCVGTRKLFKERKISHRYKLPPAYEDYAQRQGTAAY